MCNDGDEGDWYDNDGDEDDIGDDPGIFLFGEEGKFVSHLLAFLTYLLTLLEGNGVSDRIEEDTGVFVDVCDDQEEAVESLRGVAEKTEEEHDFTVDAVGVAATAGLFVKIVDDSVEEEVTDNIGEAFTEASSTLIVTYSDNQSL